MGSIPRDLSLCFVLLSLSMFVQWLRVTAEQRFCVTLIPIRVLGGVFFPLHLSRAPPRWLGCLDGLFGLTRSNPPFRSVPLLYRLDDHPPSRIRGNGVNEFAEDIFRRLRSALLKLCRRLFSPIFSPGTFFGHSSCKTTSPFWYITTLFTIFHHFWKVGRR
ncbi:hypothetical protein F5Y13DRAFT_157567 [Hypoxylon sp. FL1857]|nr:hypothetical protein F5Y13DRAFT_157567 [Hypoxylon sp. FL1857]